MALVTGPASESASSPGSAELVDDEKSTQMVRFFYKTYGVGAFEETLQRMGEGRTFDDALQAATGDTKAQFMAKFERQSN